MYRWLCVSGVLLSFVQFGCEPGNDGPSSTGGQSGGTAGNGAGYGGSSSGASSTGTGGNGGGATGSATGGTQSSETTTGGSGSGGSSSSGGVSAPLPEHSCCTESDAPGCNDPAIEACICEHLSNCCDEAWSLECTLMVRDQYCSLTPDGAPVRDCVCGDDLQTEWGQSDCCRDGFGVFCNDTAELKCGTTAICSE